MLYNYLNGANADLQELINITNQDIADIQIANNDAIFARNSKKDELIKSFEQKKGLMEQEMQKLIDANPHKSLSDLLDSQMQDALDFMRASLKDLKKLNSAYARSVFAVSEFYGSLLKRLVPTESAPYGTKGASSNKESSLLQINA